MPEFRYRRRVEFCETDAAGIAHFSAFFQYMEQAEHGLLRSLGLSVVMDLPEGKVSWPRVHARCDYSGSAHFEDELDINVFVERLGIKSVTYHFDFESNESAIAVGQITAVCCRIESGRPPEAIQIPSLIAERLRPYCASTNGDAPRVG